MNRNDEYAAYMRRRAAMRKTLVISAYYGSKAVLGKRIIPMLPPTPVYIEPFGGSAAILINRPRASHEVYNDLNETIVSFMRALQSEPERVIWDLRYRAHSRRGLRTANERIHKGIGGAADFGERLSHSYQGLGDSLCMVRNPTKASGEYATAPAHFIGARLGIKADGADGGAKPHGRLIPFGGAKGIRILLSRALTKADTINDPDGEIETIFRAANQRPEALLDSGAANCDSADDMIGLARTAMAKPHRRGADRLTAWQSLSDTFFGRALLRLKLAQVDCMKDGAAMLRSYQYESGAVMNRRGDGETPWLGRALPMGETPLYMAARRLHGVDIRNDDALNIIGEWRDNPNALIYMDPPYLHSMRTGIDKYEHEMTRAHHRRMLELAIGAKAKIAISGYRESGNGETDALYDRTLVNWRSRTWDRKSSVDTESGRRKETLWTNYDIGDWKPTQGALIGF